MDVHNDANIESAFQYRLNQFCESESLEYDDSDFTTFHDEFLSQLDSQDDCSPDDFPLDPFSE